MCCLLTSFLESLLRSLLCFYHTTYISVFFLNARGTRIVDGYKIYYKEMTLYVVLRKAYEHTLKHMYTLDSGAYIIYALNKTFYMHILLWVSTILRPIIFIVILPWMRWSLCVNYTDCIENTPWLQCYSPPYKEHKLYK